MTIASIEAEQFRGKLEKKLNLTPAKNLSDSLNEIEKQIEKLDDRYRDNASALNKLQSERENMVAKLGKLLKISQQISDKREENDKEFNKGAQDLFAVENKINAFYEEMKSIDKNRGKLEDAIADGVKNLEAIEQRGIALLLRPGRRVHVAEERADGQ